jgi:hypothetical protein
VVGAHLSHENNTPELAREALCSVVDRDSTEVMVACQEEGFDWVDLAR